MTKIENVIHLYLGHLAVTVKTNPERIDGRMIDLVRNGYYYAKPLLRTLDGMLIKEMNDLRWGNVIKCGWSPKEFLYLLSKGFDLFGLIESGQALEAIAPPEDGGKP